MNQLKNKVFNTTCLNPFIFLILAQTMVGASIVGTKYLITCLPLLSLLAIRFLLASFILFTLHIISIKKDKILNLLADIPSKQWIFILLQALTAGVFFNLLMAKGLHYTHANAAGIIASTLPAMIAMLSFLFLKEKFTARKVVSMLLATVGLLIVSMKDLHTINSRSSLLGDFIVFLALIPEAFYYVLTKAQPIRLPIFFLSGLMNLINGIVLVPITWLTLDLSLFQFSFINCCILMCVSFSSAMFYVFWYRGSSNLDAITCSLSTSIMPIATILIAWIALGELISLIQMIGVLFVILSILFGTKKSKNSAATASGLVRPS
jgi:drug/metabolite transporter (DMT)-like permease